MRLAEPGFVFIVTDPCDVQPPAPINAPCALQLSPLIQQDHLTLFLERFAISITTSTR